MRLDTACSTTSIASVSFRFRENATPLSTRQTYAQYKQDTNLVASWLAKTGMMAGCPDEMLQVSAGPAKSTRLKGKARKEAKRAAQASASASQSKKHILAIRNFVPLAEFIVDHHKDKAKDAVDVLEQFCNALSYCSGKLFLKAIQNSQPSPPPPKPSPASAPSNIFDVLSVYQTPELEVDVDAAVGETPQTSTSSSGPPPEAQQVNEYESETADTASERFLAFLALGRDLNALRQQVKSLWKAYANREMSLTSLAIATNTAIALARAIEEGVSHMFKLDRHANGMLEKLLTTICIMSGLPMGCSLDGSYLFDIRLYESMNFCMINALLFLSGWAESTGDDATSSYNGSYGWYDKMVPYESLSD